MEKLTLLFPVYFDIATFIPHLSFKNHFPNYLVLFWYIKCNNKMKEIRPRYIPIIELFIENFMITYFLSV